MGATTTNQKLLGWVKEIETLCGPKAVHWCDGSEAEIVHYARSGKTLSSMSDSCGLPMMTCEQ